MTKKAKWQIDGKELLDEDIAKLEEMARAATVGPREWAYNNSMHIAGSYEAIIDIQDGHVYSEFTSDSASAEVCESDKAFIAACDPATIIALIKLARK